jgi:ABC-2 type transport system ATP-binding protein
MESVLEARDLVKRYGPLTAVDHVSLRVAPGECLALLGPNGAGKTTTVEMLEGLTRPDSGSIRILGRDLQRERREVMEQIGVLLQDTNLYKKLTVVETLSLFASFFKRRADVHTVVARLGLTEKARTRLENLSGGQRQRVYLGCALINDPSFLFLDEPTTGLDPQARRMIWELIRSLKAEGKSFLLTTHYMDEAEQLADRVMVIDQGKIITEGTPKDLIKQVCGGEVLRLQLTKADSNTFTSLAERLPWLREAAPIDGGWEVLAPEPTKQVRDLCLVCESLGLDIESLEMRRSTLEDVFLKLTGRRMRDD